MNDNSISIELKSELETGMNDTSVNGSNSKIIVPSKEEIKTQLLEQFNQNPEKNKDNIDNVDEMATQCVQWVEQNKENDLSAQDWRWYLHYHEWVTEPYVYKTYIDQQYDEKNAFEVDNRRSVLPYEFQKDEEINFNIKVGFKGSFEVKSVFKGEISSEASKQTSVTIKGGTKVLPGLFWKVTPYNNTKFEEAMGVRKTIKITPNFSSPLPTRTDMGNETYLGINKTEGSNGVSPETSH